VSSLLEELKQDHKIMLDILDDVKKLGVASKSGQEKLLAAKAILLSHMQKEDQEFYPALKKAAEHNDDLKRTLNYFAEDMDVVSKKAMHVFDKYSRKASAAESTADITLLYMTLKDRIRTEEEILFKKFEKADCHKGGKNQVASTG
jgi:iron-sulfur cluster repair protein YtfE (RIC family)